MQATTEAPTILYVRGDEQTDVVTDIDSDGYAVTSLQEPPVDESGIFTDTIERLLTEHDPDCLLLSDRIGIEPACVLVEMSRQQRPSLPLVAFATEPSTIDALVNAGVTELIHAASTTAPVTLVERRLTTALATMSAGTELDRALGETTPLLFQEITESINDVVWINSLGDSGLDYVNRAYEDVWGRSPEHLYDDRYSLLETLHPDDRERVQEAMKKQLTDPEAYDVTYRVVRPDGAVRWVHSRAVGVRLNGELDRIVGIATDITDQKRNEAQLEAERDLVERILETSPVGIVVIDTAGEIVRANEQAGTILGISRGELEGGSHSPDEITVYDMDGPQLTESEFPFHQIKATGEPLSGERLTVRHPHHEDTIISVDGVPLFADGSLQRIVITFDDITDRVAREQQLEEQRNELAELAHVNRIIRSVDDALLGAESKSEVLQAVCDTLAASARYHYAIALEFAGNQRLDATEWTAQADEFVEEFFPITGPPTTNGPAATAIETTDTQIVRDLHSQPALKETWVERLQESGIASLAAIPIVYEGTEYGAIGLFATDEAFGDHKLTVLDELGETVGHAIAAVESREREQTLTSLYRATEQFLAADTPQEVSDVVVDTATDVLDFSGFGVFLLDDETTLLSPVSATDQLLDFFGETQVFGPGKSDSITWHTYITGEPQYYDDVRTSDRLANESTSARSSLLIPLGDHGVFVAASTEIGVFDDPTRRLVRLLGTTAEAALDRVTGQADIRERDAEIQTYRERLDDLQTLLSFTQDVTALSQRAGSRAELETELCARLTDQDGISFAWVGRQHSESGELTPETWAGPERGYLDSVSLERTQEPATRTFETGEVTRVSNVTHQIHESSWAREALDRDYQSVLAVPLRFEDTDYGVLAVYCSEPEAFTEQMIAVAETLADTIAFNINSLETRRSILDDQPTEVTVSLGETETPMNRVADYAGERIPYREIPSGENTVHLLFTLSVPPVSEILALESAFVTVESVTHTERGERELFRLTVSGETVSSELRDCGGLPREGVATPTETHVTVDLPTEVGSSEFVDRLRNQYPETELIAKQDTGHSETTRGLVRALDDRLTQRQQQVLVSAYESGYFESPRVTTGQELADLLDISQPTVTHHLREAQRRTFKKLFGSE